MIQYRSGKWALAFACSLKGSVFPRAVAVALPCALLSAGLHQFFVEAGALEKANIDNTNLTVLGGFSFILGFLLVFNTQQAYTRWWEGATLLRQLRGEWFNAFSCCIAFCNASPDKSEEVCSFQHRLVRLISMLYGAALTEVAESSSNELQFIDLDDFDPESMRFLEESRNKSEIVLQWVQRLIVEAQDANILKIAPPILSRVYNQLGNGIVMLNNAAKLNDFPFPFPLAQMTTFLLLLQWILTTFVVAAVAKDAFWAGLISFCVIFSFWGVHYIGLELERPFGDDTNDLPMREMQMDMNTSLCELMHHRARFTPSFAFEAAKHTALHMENVSLGGYIEIIVSRALDGQEAIEKKLVEKPPQISHVKSMDLESEGRKVSRNSRDQEMVVKLSSTSPSPMPVVPCAPSQTARQSANRSSIGSSVGSAAETPKAGASPGELGLAILEEGSVQAVFSTKLKPASGQHTSG